MKTYLSYLPPFLQEYQEIQAIAKVEDKVLEALWQAFTSLEENQWIQTANEEGIRRREKMMGLPGSTLSLEERRTRILSNWNAAIPFTDETFRQWVDSMMGDAPYTLVIDGSRYLVELTLHKMYSARTTLFLTTGRNMVPANMEMRIEFLYNQYSQCHAFTHGALAAWQHRQLSEEAYAQ